MPWRAQRRLLAVAALLALAALGAPRPAEAAVPADFWGMNVQEFTKNFPESDWPRFFDVLRGIDARVARQDFMHEDYEKAGGGYDWSRADKIFTELASRGMRVRAVLLDNFKHPGTQDQPYY